MVVPFVLVGKLVTRITVESIYNKINEGRVLIESKSTVAARKMTEKLLYEIDKDSL